MFWKKKTGLQLSVIVIFHNMQREAARTLFSLTPAYQQGVSAEEYEVIAIDSSSSSPLDPAWVKSFGPQFSYHSVDWEYPSPCRAMNEGVKLARGKNVMCVVDGARILSPGILSKTLEVFKRDKSPFVYTLGMHLGPKVQNESILDGYDQKEEDVLLEGIGWQQNGYKLFNVSSVALSSRQGFYSQLSESNCFALDKKRFFDFGGFNEGFKSPGGGLVNLAFFNNVMSDATISPVMLLGEATFHQYHGGVATNVPMADHPWQKFSAEYTKLYGQEYEPVYREPSYFGVITAESEHLSSTSMTDS